MGIVDAASSLGVADFNIDDYPGVVAWASCPQKGMLSLPLTTPVSFTDKAIEATLITRRRCAGQRRPWAATSPTIRPV